MAGCAGCPLQKKFPDNTFVPPQVGASSRVAVGEAPGETEASEGRPFCGGAGKWLEFLYKKAGVKKDDVNLINVIQCRPKDNVFPTDRDAKGYISAEDGHKAVEHCLQAHTLPFLHSRPWDRIDLLGGKALEFVGKRDGGIYKYRGAPLTIEGFGPKPLAIATLHPAAIARDQQMLPAVINDLAKGLQQPPEHYNLHPTLADVQAFTAKTFAFDIETAYWWGDRSKILCVGLSDRLYHAMVVPFEGPYIPELKRIFANAECYIGQNSIAFDQPMLEEKGIKFNPLAEHHDSMLLHHLRFPDLPHGLDDLGSYFTGKGVWKDQKREDLALYNARDVDVTFQVWKQLVPMVKAEGLWNLYRRVQIPLARICKKMTDLGIKIDPSRLEEVRAKVALEMKELEKALPENLQSHTIIVHKRKPAPPGTLGKSGKPVKYIQVPIEELETPWASSVQIQKWLYEDLALEPVHDLKTDNITSGKMALDKLAGKCRRDGRDADADAIKAIRTLRKKASILNLFAKEEMVKATTVHGSFLVHGTNSGRLSSSSPNLHNVTEAARCLYVPRHRDWSLVDIDFSSIESRLTAYLANDQARLQKYLTIPDYSEHKYLASVLTGCDYNDVVKDNSRDAPYGRAKAVVHGANYALGAKKMSMMNDMPLDVTKEILDRWKQEIRETVVWQAKTADQARRDGFLTTPFGRKRYFYTSSLYTESLAFLPQSTAADIIFRCMIALMYERIDWPLEDVAKVVQYIEPLPRPANLLLCVHDSLVFECPNDLLPKLIGVAQRVMTQPWPELGGFSIPISIAVGPSWGETEKYTGPIV